MSTSTLERPQIADPELETTQGRKTHIIKKESATDAYVFGEPVQALCGYVWVPSRDPKNYPICPACKELAEMLWGPGGAEDLDE